MSSQPDFVLTQEDLLTAIERGKKPYYGPDYADWLNAEWERIAGNVRYGANVLGHFEYTPADELRDRLNDWIQGKPPAEPINTRYWRKL